MSSVNTTGYTLFCFPVYTKDSILIYHNTKSQTSIELFPNNAVAVKKIQWNFLSIKIYYKASKIQLY